MSNYIANNNQKATYDRKRPQIVPEWINLF